LVRVQAEKARDRLGPVREGDRREQIFVALGYLADLLQRNVGCEKRMDVGNLERLSVQPEPHRLSGKVTRIQNLRASEKTEDV
jgi:hypothetical protein